MDKKVSLMHQLKFRKKSPIFPELQLMLVLTDVVISTFSFVIVFFENHFTFNALKDLGAQLHFHRESQNDKS